jgi:hypothetical protein
MRRQTQSGGDDVLCGPQRGHWRRRAVASWRLSPSAQAAYTLTLLQQGPDVVATGSGTLDLTDLTLAVGISSRALVAPAFGTTWTGPVTATDGDVYGDTTGPELLEAVASPLPIAAAEIWSVFSAVVVS